MTPTTKRQERQSMSDINSLIIKASEYEQLGDYDNMFETISEGLKLHCHNYELYYMLGFYYLRENANQAYLCFKNAYYYCDNQNDQIEIQNSIGTLLAEYDISVKKTAFIIVSYNSAYMMQKCIESIRSSVPDGDYALIIVDNASTDGVVDYLRSQNDIILYESNTNLGFSPACNLGVKVAYENDFEDYDIFLLNNDTRLSVNSLFWLKMGLYSNDNVGATGSLANYAGNKQQIDVEFQLPNDYLEYAKSINIPRKDYLEERVRLSGFSMLIRSGLWSACGGMDELFSPGYFEDDDLCMKILKAGYRLYVCKNSFIYHAGSQSFIHCKNIDHLLVEHHKLFIEKYGFDILNYAYSSINDFDSIPYTKESAFNVLVIGCGLGSTMKEFRNRWNNANIIGIEYNNRLLAISSQNELVLDSLKTLKEIVDQPIFNVVILENDVKAFLSEEEYSILTELCCSDCHLLTDKPQINSYDFALEKVKLIIWDLDNTFWEGTLSEGRVSVLPQNIELIKALDDMGIINSISSKNDEDTVMKVLSQIEISDYFVFNNINWTNKGQQIKQKIEDMNLRCENVLFIDDEVHNLKEAQYYNPGILTALPDIIPQLLSFVSDESRLRNHSRLESYRILENKIKDKNHFSDSRDFLFQSNIRVEICHDCMNEFARIEELIARTNQLNFTKIRDIHDDILSFLNDPAIDKGYVRVSDKYGDYGIAGFYCFESGNQKLRHFLFSCRIMGMGVENYIYKAINCPPLNVVEPISGNLDNNFEPSWINAPAVPDTDNNSRSSESSNKIRILLKGPCDMAAIETYLIGGDITTEFNFVNDKGFITAGQNHTMNIWEYAHLSSDEIQTITEEVPFITEGDYKTSLFDNEYDVICLSLLPDCHSGLYQNKEAGYYINFGSTNFDLTDPKFENGYIDGSVVNHFFPFTKEIIQDFRDNWTYVGTISEEHLIRNLDYIFENVKGTPLIILLLGSEIEYQGENEEFANHASRHARINALIKEHYGLKSNIAIVNPTDYILSQDDYEDSINHYSRNVYYNMTTDIVSHINKKVLEIAKRKN